MKPGEVYKTTHDNWTTYVLIVSTKPLRATVIQICDGGPVVLRDHEIVLQYVTEGKERATWADWAEAVAKLTDHLLAEPAEAME